MLAIIFSNLLGNIIYKHGTQFKFQDCHQSYIFKNVKNYNLQKCQQLGFESVSNYIIQNVDNYIFPENVSKYIFGNANNYMLQNVNHLNFPKYWQS